MRKFLFPILLIVLSTAVNAQSPSFSWVKQLGGSLRDNPTGLDIDANGNIYTSGYFMGTADFDPGQGTFTLSSPGTISAFACKLDPQGNLLWVKQIGAYNNAPGSSVHAWGQALSANGDLYITGTFGGIVDFDPGAGITTYTSNADDIFMMKLDAQGNFLWAKQIGGSILDVGYSLAVDAVNAVYCTGFFMDVVDFDPAPTSSYSLSATSGQTEAFVLKLDASGNFVWADKTNSSVAATGNGITLDNSGNVYSTGIFLGTSDLDPGIGVYALNSAGSQDSYVWKLDPGGNFLWAKGFGGSLTDGGNDVITDAQGNVLTTGFFSGSGDFDPGAGTFSLTSAGVYDIYISKFDAQGNFIWAKRIGGSGVDATSALALGANGDVYSTGQFESTVDFDPGSGSYTLAASAGNGFISKLDGSGNFKWAEQLAGPAYSAGNDIAVDAATSIYTAGSFSLTTDFDPGAGTYTLSSFGMEDIFVHKMTCGNSPAVISNLTQSVICAGNSTTLTASGASTFTWNTINTGSSYVVNPTVTTTYSVVGTDNNGCSASSFVTQTVSLCTGIKQMNNSALLIQVYPNPSKTSITVAVEQLSDNELTIKLSNSLGQTVMTVYSKTAQTQLLTDQLPAGIYFLNVIQNNKQYEPVKVIREE